MIKYIWNIRKNLYNRKEVIEMGFLDGLFSSSSGKGGPPDYLKRDYEKFGLDPDHEVSVVNKHKKMYCTRCRRIYNGGAKCQDCGNILVEWH